MVISKTPFRISFFGGGTDYPVWYNEHPGAVLSTTIDKYCYITARHLPPFFDYKFRVRYTQREETLSIEEIKHPSVKACLSFLNEDNSLNNGVEIAHNSDLPACTGMGSSSAFTVGLLHALYALKGQIIAQRALALNAIHVEHNIIKEHVGSQDQVAAAMGGLNRIDFSSIDININPLTLKASRIKELQQHLLLFFTGFTRIASDIAAVQISQTKDRTTELSQMYQLVDEAIKILSTETDITTFGKLLHQTWLLKRSLTNRISTTDIDNIYDKALSAGALGGKLLGAGGGGCILFFVTPEKQPEVINALKPLLLIPFAFETQGSQIIYYDPHGDI